MRLQSLSEPLAEERALEGLVFEARVAPVRQARDEAAHQPIAHLRDENRGVLPLFAPKIIENQRVFEGFRAGSHLESLLWPAFSFHDPFS